MTLEDLSEKAWNSSLLKTLGRVALVLILPLAGWFWNLQNDAIAKQTVIIQQTADTLETVTRRVDNIEIRMDTGKAAREKLETRVDGLQGDVNRILQSVVRIETILSEQDRVR